MHPKIQYCTVLKGACNKLIKLDLLDKVDSQRLEDARCAWVDRRYVMGYDGALSSYIIMMSYMIMKAPALKPGLWKSVYSHWKTGNILLLTSCIRVLLWTSTCTGSTSGTVPKYWTSHSLQLPPTTCRKQRYSACPCFNDATCNAVLHL